MYERAQAFAFCGQREYHQDMDLGEEVVAATSGDVYYTGKYWNDFPFVNKEINRRATNDPNMEWYEHFFTRHAKRPFQKVLMLNCGNGWVERNMHKKGFVREVVGVDYADDLLKEARAKAGKRPFRYYKMDINSGKFPEGGFDLVINHAAGHHIAKLNKVFHELLKIMNDGAIFLNFDYVGPHRNQYHHTAWHKAHEINKSLPETCRQIMEYPHLPTMLVTDPSEAVHAELILPIMQRFFEFEFFKPIGGAIAYPLLTHNQAIQKAPRHHVTKALRTIMEADAAHTQEFPESTLFAYWAARPKKEVLKDTQKLVLFQKEEDLREKAVARNGGRYYVGALLQELYEELSDLRLAKQHKQSYIEDLQRKMDEKERQFAEALAKERARNPVAKAKNAARRVAGKVRKTLR